MFSFLKPAQKQELRVFTQQMQALQTEYSNSYRELIRKSTELLNICRYCLSENRSVMEQEYLAVYSGQRRFALRDPLIQVETPIMIQAQIVKFSDYLDNIVIMTQELGATQTQEWFPSKYRKAKLQWAHLFFYSLQELENAFKALQAPQPLECNPQAGRNYLNLFISSVNSLNHIHKYQPNIPTDY